MKLSKEQIGLPLNGTRDERVYACARSFRCSGLTISPNCLTFKPAPFHKDFDQDIEELVTGNVKDVGWIAFRESAKTSDAKIAVAWIIARQQVIDALRAQGEKVSHRGERRYINVDSYDKSNAESILFVVVMELQTNGLLVADFGHLYNQPRTKDQATLKCISLGHEQRHSCRGAHGTHPHARAAGPAIPP